ncbi:hypothetical protein LZD49_26410 [Dyadobacter sp. CY261]|uniref:hypothetical protein n=1 Tax=Dyadobacter sp. CY261 TaxID=2907203 RepID=UPI001F2C2F73|nr:hypothetical protein [Dyadobacter sp. CY261]MCF0074043.1 hypothetical protein [Dyadobacter sp. CY261]
MEASTIIAFSICYTISAGFIALLLMILSEDMKDVFVRILTYTMFVPVVNCVVAAFFAVVMCYKLIADGPKKEEPDKGKA